jgi:transcriptional regulator with XRE-family HTH domain
MTKTRKFKTNAAKLKALVDKSGRSSLDIAEELGVDRSTVSRWLAGTTNPSFTAMKSLAQILEVEVEDFELKAA